MRMTHKMLALLACAGGTMLFSTASSQAQTTATTVVTLAALDVTAITATPTLAVTPIAADYSGSSPNVTAALPIVLTITTTRTAGCHVTVSGTPGALLGGISNDDLRLKSSHSGSQVTTFTSLSDIGNSTFWNSTAPQTATAVNVDVNIKNLVAYPGVNAYTNTLTFTAVPN